MGEGRERGNRDGQMGEEREGLRSKGDRERRIKMQER